MSKLKHKCQIVLYAECHGLAVKEDESHLVLECIYAAECVESCVFLAVNDGHLVTFCAHEREDGLGYHGVWAALCRAGVEVDLLAVIKSSRNSELQAK